MQPATEPVMFAALLMMFSAFLLSFRKLAEQLTDCRPRRRKKKIAVEDFDVVVDGLAIAPDKVIPQELSMLASIIGRDNLIHLLNETREY